MKTVRLSPVTENLYKLSVSSSHPSYYYFDGFEIDVRQRTLSKEGELVPLPAKPFSLLLVLLANQGVELSKDYLMNAVWHDSRVEMSNLTQSIFLLRRLLERKSSNHRLIITVPGKGYIFTGVVRSADAHQATAMPLVNSVRYRPQKQPTVAVLPFQIFDISKKTGYLGIGIADALITRLSHIEQINVRSTETVRLHKGHSRDLQTAGRELGVDFLIVGAIHVELVQADKVTPIRVTVQMVNVQSGDVIWSDSIEDELSRILALQDKLAEATSNAVTYKLMLREKGLIPIRHTEDSGAYQDYLKGRYYAGQYTIRGWSKAITCFGRAVQKDPNYALAYCGIADANYMAANLYLSPLEVMPNAQAASNRALVLSSDLAEAHTSAALVKGFLEWNWHEAEVSFREAIRINERSASVHFWFGRLLTAAGRFSEAIEELKYALQLDPLSAAMNAELGRTLYYAGRYEDAMEQLRETLELDPNFWPSHLFLGWVYEQQGHLPEAIAILQRASGLDDNPRTKAFLGAAYACAGDEMEAEKILISLKESSKRRYVSADYIAAIYIALGDTTRSLQYLTKAYEGRSGWLVWLGVDPHFDALRHDPRFQQLIENIGIPANHIKGIR